MPTFRVVSNKGNPVKGARVLVTYYGIMGSNSSGSTDNNGYVTVSGSGTCDISVSGKTVVKRQDISSIREVVA